VSPVAVVANMIGDERLDLLSEIGLARGDNIITTGRSGIKLLFEYDMFCFGLPCNKSYTTAPLVLSPYILGKFKNAFTFVLFLTASTIFANLGLSFKPSMSPLRSSSS
jgi:hypothetical protein